MILGEVDERILASGGAVEADDPGGTLDDERRTAKLAGTAEEFLQRGGELCGHEGDGVRVAVGGDEADDVTGPGAYGIGLEGGCRAGGGAYQDIGEGDTSFELDGVFRQFEYGPFLRLLTAVAAGCQEGEEDKKSAGAPPEGEPRR